MKLRQLLPALLIAATSLEASSEGPAGDELAYPPNAMPKAAAEVAPPQAKPTPTAPAPDPAPRARQRGSLYSDAAFQALTADRRAFRIGDLVTVLVYENSSASSSADTSGARDSNVGIGVTGPSTSKNYGVTANNDFNGTGRTQRAGRVLTQLTVAVQELQPGGVLAVSGEQQLEINGEKQTIRLEGRIRSRDINEQNVVLSTRVADARISFVGDGLVAESQRPRWWQRLLGLFGI